MGTALKPYLFLDVDGPVNPYRLITRKGHLEPKARKGEERYSYTKHHLYPKDWDGGLPVLLSKQMGADLDSLQDSFDLVWATTWEHEANELLSPLLGLPDDLPVIEWDLTHPSLQNHLPDRGSWKTPLLVDWLEARPSRPWVFVDDELFRKDRDYVRAHLTDTAEGSHPWWMLRIDPLHGLRRNDVEDLRQWARRLTS